MVRFIIGNKTYISQQEQLDLHSNMVRFIIYEVQVLNMLIAMIYIPIWLDLLLKGAYKQPKGHANLHSNMVRFIITNRHEYG